MQQGKASGPETVKRRTGSEGELMKLALKFCPSFDNLLTFIEDAVRSYRTFRSLEVIGSKETG